MADVYTTNERPRDTVVVERDNDHGDHTYRSNTGVIIAVVILGLIIVFLLLGRSFGGGGGGKSGAPTITAPSPTTAQ